MREYQRAPRGYELMALINPEIADEALTATVDAVTEMITSSGGEITLIKRDTPWGRRRLAYPIQRFRDATYVLYQFKASPTSISSIERDLKLDERIIRYLLVRQDSPAPVEEEPSDAPAASEPEVVEPTTVPDGNEGEPTATVTTDNEAGEPEPESDSE